MRLVDFNTAKTLQDLGYDGEYTHFYHPNGQCESLIDNIMMERNIPKRHIPVPRLDDAAYWLRDRRGILIDIKPKGSGQYNVWLEFGFRKQMFDQFVVLKNSYDTYDDALAAGIKEVVKNIIESRQK